MLKLLLSQLIWSHAHFVTYYEIMALFQIEKHILPPMRRTRWNSVQYRLARKADNKLTYKQAEAAPEMEGSWKPGN